VHVAPSVNLTARDVLNLCNNYCNNYSSEHTKICWYWTTIEQLFCVAQWLSH